MSAPWYKSGLQFKCEGTDCGDCCSGRWGPGYVWLTLKEMKGIAKALEITFDQFTLQYVRKVGERYSLIERPNHDCIFYVEGKGCSVYDARPGQCRSYPFWPHNIDKPEDWQEQAEQCPGIGCGDPCDKWSRKEIDKSAALYPSARELRFP